MSKFAKKCPEILKFLNFFVFLQRICQINTKTTPKRTKTPMKRNFLPPYVGISMTKSQFCFSTGCTPYKLRCILSEKAAKYKRLGYNKWDKLLMPAVIRELCSDTGLKVDVDYYTQYVAGQRGHTSQIVTE